MFQYHFSTDLVEQLLKFTGNHYQQEKKEVLLHQESAIAEACISAQWYCVIQL